MPSIERRPTVFVSYAREDAEFARRLIADLEAAGHACWIDTGAIKGGEEWLLSIANGISDSYAFLVIVSLDALASRWVRDEIVWARQKDKLIVPLMLADLHGDARFFALTGCQSVRLFAIGPDAALRELLRALPAPTVAATESDPQRRLELEYLDRLRLEELLNTSKYTPMTGASEQQRPRVEMRAVFELLPMGQHRGLPRQTRRFENAVTELRRLRRAVLLGEPGGGKTTTIWKLAAELVEEAAQLREAPIPLLIRLGRWTDAEQPLEDFIASQLGGLGASLDALLAQKRAALLLDGLNELPAGQRGAKYPQVRRLIEAHPPLLAVVSCRELDYTDDLGFDRITITPLDPLRIREFTSRYLDEIQGEALFWRLAGGASVQAVWDAWQRAGASFEQFWTAPDIPRENPNVYGVTTTQQDALWREKVRGQHSLMELARNPYMLLMLTSVFAEQGDLPDNRGELFRLFVETLLRRERIAEIEQAPLTEGLARVAYAMQTRRAPNPQENDPEAEADAGDARTVLSKPEAAALLDDRTLYLAGSAGILSVGEQVRFTHQLLQEYFAANFMDGEIRAGRLKASDLWPRDGWWQRTNWEEAAILLAGLHGGDCSRIVEWVAEANPEAAAMCATRGGAALAEATAERLRVEWIPRLTDLKRDLDPKARAALGRAVDLIGGDNRPGVGVIRNAQGVALPGIDWVEIPGGEFQYGLQDESQYVSKPQRLTLPTFYISRYPLTYAQFQTFLDDAEGFADPRWFEGLAASENERRMEEQSFQFANHPRDTINWYQAMAFCRWLSWRLVGGSDLKKVTDWAVRLPTEFEWEKAARGTDGRIYPYAGDFDAAKGNTDETGIGQTSAAGIFPNGASPYGVMDMSGNVWEWCLSNYDKPALEARKENLRTDKARVLRGGSWFYVRGYARSVSRYIYLPADRNFVIGCRVVCVVRPPSL